MNIHVPIKTAIHTPVRLTVDDVRLLAQKGSLGNQERYELIDGVLYQMPAEGTPHTLCKSDLTHALARQLDPAQWRLVPDAPLILSATRAPEPDLYIYPRQIDHDDLRGGDVTLVIEVSASSLKWDSEVKSRIYAEHGVQEYWIVDVEGRQTKVLRKPLADGDWGEAAIVPFDAPLRAAGLDGLELTIASLPNLSG